MRQLSVATIQVQGIQALQTPTCLYDIVCNCHGLWVLSGLPNLTGLASKEGCMQVFPNNGCPRCGGRGGPGAELRIQLIPGPEQYPR